MKLRKTNAVFSLISTMLLFVHAISLAAWMLSQGKIPKLPSAMPRALTMFFLVHAILSIVIFISSTKGREKHNGKHYFKLNRATLIQRIIGILLLPLTVPHILGAVGVITPSPLVHAILPPLFFSLIMVHVAISTSKAFITLGIGNARFVKCLDIVIKVVCVVTLIADIIGFYLYVC